ncbi:PH domain-containing protein [Shewanella jiangmenensis]|nr:PH domain-containing protein [Shewanella jiangmenensis]
MQEQDLDHSAAYRLLEPGHWSVFELPALQRVEKSYAKMLSIMVTVPIAALVLGLSVLLWRDGLHQLLWGVPAIVLLLCLAAVYLCRRHVAHLGYGVTELEIISQKGIWWQSRTALPYSRIQHVTLSQGPLERRFGLARIECFSAGSGTAEIEIAGLAEATAEALRSHLLGKAGAQDA